MNRSFELVAKQKHDTTLDETRCEEMWRVKIIWIEMSLWWDETSWCVDEWSAKRWSFNWYL